MKGKMVYINEYRVDLDYSVEKNIKSFKEEALKKIYFHHKESSVNSILFSGGKDSTFLLRALQELGVTPELHTFSFSKDQTDYTSLKVKEQCKKFGVKEPEFFYMDKYELFKHIDFLTFENRMAYPSLHCYYVDYYLSKMEGKRFFCGMSCEFRYSHGIVFLNIPPPAIKYFNPDRLYGYDCSETFFAFINDPVFKDNYLKPNPMIAIGENVWRIRDLIYYNCYPELELTDKQPSNNDYITVDYHQQKLPVIQRLFPIIFFMQPFRFNVHEYFRKKEQLSV